MCKPLARGAAHTHHSDCDLLTPLPRMQLSQSDELYSVQKLLWSSIGLPAVAQPADLQKVDLPSCLAAARAVCLQRVSWLLQTQQ
jgi:hypothetical protein